MLTLARFLVLAAAGCCALAAIEREPAEVYRERRQELARNRPDGVILMFGYGAGEAQYARGPFRQENNFYYLTGWNEPGAALLIAPASEDSPYEETLFLPRRDRAEELWTGPRSGAGESGVAARTGFQTVLGAEFVEKRLRAALDRYSVIYSLLPRPEPSHGQQPEPDRRGRLKRLAPGVEIRNIRPAVDRMRLVKSAGELRLIQKAVDASAAAHRAAWRRIEPGIFEYQIVAAMWGPLMERGCLRMAYAPIAGAGRNSTILHYRDVTGRVDAGALVVMDVGGEYAHYAADLTRTVPASGRFSERQRKVYEAVLAAQRALIGAVRPGMTLSGEGPASLRRLARKLLDEEGKKRLGRRLGRYMFHGVGHHVGLAVHDPGGPDEPLEAGMVVTVEPGAYLREEGLGVRIEDMVLVTEDGARALSAGLPKDVQAIERAMSRGAAGRTE